MGCKHSNAIGNPFTLALLTVALFVGGCGSSSPAAGQKGYLGTATDGVIFVQWTEVDGRLTGQFEELALRPSDPLDFDASNSGLAGVRNGTSMSFDLLGSTRTLTGTLNGDTLTLVGPDQTGLLGVIAMRPGTAEDYNNAATAFRDRVHAAQARATASVAAAQARASATAAATVAAIARAEGITLPSATGKCPSNSTHYLVDDSQFENMAICVFLGDEASYYLAPNQAAPLDGSAGCNGLNGGTSWQAIADGSVSGSRLCILDPALQFLKPQADAARAAAFQQACVARGGQVQSKPAGNDCEVSYPEVWNGSVIQSQFSVALNPDGSWDQAKADDERQSCEHLAALDAQYPTDYHAEYHGDTGVCNPQSPGSATPL
jgi:hypothetical protein